MKKIRIILIIPLLSLVTACTSEPEPGAQESVRERTEFDWTGNWNTISRTGRSRMELTQEDSSVTGIVQPASARIEAIARGSLLEGTWATPKIDGTFLLTMSPDGETFAGRFATGEWFNGRRDTNTTDRGIQEADLTTPRTALRSFLTAFNQYRDGILTVTAVAVSTVDFGQNNQNLAPREKFIQAEALYRVIDQCTFRLWDLFLGAGGSTVTAVLEQEGTEQTFDLRMIQRDGRWYLSSPPLDVLEQKLEDLHKARGIEVVDPDGYRKRETPRAALRTFLAPFMTPDQRETLPPGYTMDLSEIDESVRESEGIVLGEYLFGLLARVSPVIYQEIPDDPDRTLPYIHFNHPEGRIEVAPYGEEKRKVWKFSAATVHALRDLYSSFEAMPVVKEAKLEQAEEPPFFRFRNWLGEISPLFLDEAVLIENWQWIGLIVIGIVGWIVGFLIALPVSMLIRATLRMKPGASGKGNRLLRPLRIAFMASFWLFTLPELRIPDTILPYLKGAATGTLVIGIVWTFFIITDMIGAYLRDNAARIHKNLDDVFTSLLVGVAKIAIFVIGVLLFAEGIGLNYGTVLAGLGIGGLAFAIAAQDTIANFFGSAVVLADRPFRKGDLIKAGDIEGEVEKVGLRSSQIRTFEDSVYIVPNRMMANEAIDNRGRRRSRRIRSVLSVQYDTPPDKLDAFAQGVRKLLEDQESVLKEKVHVGVWDYAASSIDLMFICYIDVPTWAEEIKERHRLFVAVTRLAAEMGVEYAFPTRTVHLFNEEKKG